MSKLSQRCALQLSTRRSAQAQQRYTFSCSTARIAYRHSCMQDLGSANQAPCGTTYSFSSRIISCQRTDGSGTGHLCLQPSAPWATALGTCYPAEKITRVGISCWRSKLPLLSDKGGGREKSSRPTDLGSAKVPQDLDLASSAIRSHGDQVASAPTRRTGICWALAPFANASPCSIRARNSWRLEIIWSWGKYSCFVSAVLACRSR
jgi:hypothetical protein